jgi:hypothetical protein
MTVDDRVTLFIAAMTARSFLISKGEMTEAQLLRIQGSLS